MILDIQQVRRLKAAPQDTGQADDPAPTPSGCHPDPRWYVVSTYAQAERRAAQSLTHKGYEVYLPTLIIQRRDRVIRSMLHRIEAPLFPSYLFIRLDLRDPWYPVRYAPGVFKLLTNADNMPNPISEAILSALQAGDALRRLPAPDTPLLRPGAPVTCLHGAFYGREAVVIAAATNTARIALPMLGAIREITVPIQSLAIRE
jgi:transcription antitermination factor NusG